MGHFVHHAIVATAYKSNSEHFAAIYQQARESSLRDVMTPIMVGANGYASFAILPDGSKEGWPASDAGDVARAKIKALLSKHYIDWVEVCFGGDTNTTARVTGDSYE